MGWGVQRKHKTQPAVVFQMPKREGNSRQKECCVCVQGAGSAEGQSSEGLECPDEELTDLGVSWRTHEGFQVRK